MEAVVVNGAEIPPQTIAAEMQHHPAPTQERAWAEAATALVIRELLLQEASRLGVAADVEANGEIGAEEALIHALLVQEVITPEPDEATCRRYWSANPEKFRAPDVYEAAHILFPASPEDRAAREATKLAAAETLVLVVCPACSIAWG